MSLSKVFMYALALGLLVIVFPGVWYLLKEIIWYIGLLLIAVWLFPKFRKRVGV